MNRILWIDVIRVIAIFSVVLLHVSSPYLYEFMKIPMDEWWVANLYDSMVRMSVPLFFMITGVIFLKIKNEPLIVYFKKRFIKIIIPLIVWSFIYIFFRIYVEGENINVFKHMVLSLVRKEYFHLWFLYAMVGIYLFIPILKIFIQNSSEELQYYFLLLFVVASAIIPIITDIFLIDIPNYLTMMQGFGGYLVLGYVLSNIKLTNYVFWGSIILIIITTYSTAVGTYYLTIEDGNFNDFFYDSFSITTIFQASASFIVLRYLGERINTSKNAIYYKMIIPFSMTSFGIYLVHPIIIWFMKYKSNWGMEINLLYYIPITSMVVFLVSFIIIATMQKLPLVKYMVP